MPDRVPADHVERARAMVGTRFRLQGREPEGLDCVGLALRAYGIEASDIPRDYRLRGDHLKTMRKLLALHFNAVKQGRAGDLMLLAPAPDQLHLAVMTDVGFVHAHAGLRRVVETPGKPALPLLGMYRRRATKRN